MAGLTRSESCEPARFLAIQALPEATSGEGRGGGSPFCDKISQFGPIRAPRRAHFPEIQAMSPELWRTWRGGLRCRFLSLPAMNAASPSVSSAVRGDCVVLPAAANRIGRKGRLSPNFARQAPCFTSYQPKLAKTDKAAEEDSPQGRNFSRPRPACISICVSL